jgi:hypothetical protein
MLEHLKLMDEADLTLPMILSSDGAVMDGMHRVARSVRQGRNEIEAAQFDVDPEPDSIGLGPKDLPYQGLTGSRVGASAVEVGGICRI